MLILRPLQPGTGQSSTAATTAVQIASSRKDAAASCSGRVRKAKYPAVTTAKTTNAWYATRFAG
jgi:hypothetical protein